MIYVFSPCEADKTLKCVFASTGVTIISMAPSYTSIDNLKASVKAIYSDRTVFRELWHIERTPFKKFMTNLRKWKKLTHVPRFLTSTAKSKSYGDKTQMWSLTQLQTQSLKFYWFRLLSWIRNFLATNGKGYDNSRLSDDIDRGSRQIHDKWLRFTCPSCIWSQNGLAMKTSVKPL